MTKSFVNLVPPIFTCQVSGVESASRCLLQLLLAFLKFRLALRTLRWQVLMFNNFTAVQTSWWLSFLSGQSADCCRLCPNVVQRATDCLWWCFRQRTTNVLWLWHQTRFSSCWRSADCDCGLGHRRSCLSSGTNGLILSYK